MRFIPHTLLIIVCLCFWACGKGEKTLIADYRIVPRPAETELRTDGDFTLDADTRIVCGNDSEAMRANAGFLAEYIREVTGFVPAIVAGDSSQEANNRILLRADSTGHGGESYRIEIDPCGIVVQGTSDAGVFYALQTLRKSIGAAKAAKIVFPAVRIEDAPAFGYRGIMLDVARTFYPVETVKRIIDLAALHNLNVFHWHLTDDQGWRVEIDAYPELTRTGAFRRDTTSTGEAGIFGGYYTKQQVREVVNYAAQRFIEVIPEIDMPGHMMAVLASCPDLGCTGGPYTITSQPGVRRDILCAGNPRSLEFAEKVLEEVIALFPSEYIHIGGDESPRIRWEQCPKCQTQIRKAGLRDDAEHSAEAKLQGWFNTRIEEFLTRHGRKLIGWDEIVDGGMSPRATVMSWRGTAGGIKAAERGFDVIMSPNSSLYFDYYQSYDCDAEPPTIGGYVPLKKVYDMQPVPDELSPEQARHIIGVQANVWSTYMRSTGTLEHMILPRMAALSEVAWSDREKNYGSFMERLDRLTPFYERDSCAWFPWFYDIRGTFVADYDRRAVGMVLESLPESDIRYTLDGSLPTAQSPVYTDTVWISSPAMIRAQAVLPDGRPSEPFAEQLQFNKATMKPLQMLTEPDPKFSRASLNDGLHGKKVFTYGNWVGYYDHDADVVVDLGRTQPIAEVSFDALLDFGSHIVDAAGVTILTSDDGENFREVYSEKYPEVPYGAVKRIFRHRATFDPALEARYVRLQVARSEHLPEAYFDRSLQPYLFIDEIYIY